MAREFYEATAASWLPGILASWRLATIPKIYLYKIRSVVKWGFLLRVNVAELDAFLCPNKLEGVNFLTQINCLLIMHAGHAESNRFSRLISAPFLTAVLT